jgi:hypothetical protein
LVATTSAIGWWAGHRAEAGIVATPGAAEPVTAAIAQRDALDSGQPVEVTANTTPTGVTVANPDGTFTTSLSAMPVRVRKAGSWVPLDATLIQQSDGAWSPTASTVSLRLSGGGSTTLATMVNDGQQLSLGWPTVLPVPVVSGSTANYPDVLPGVDLQVNVGSQGGFAHVLVVRTPVAAQNPALASLHLTVQGSTGMALASDDSGNLAATDAFGRTLFTSPAPRMWDSTGSPKRVAQPGGPGDDPAVSNAARPGSLARSAEVGVGVQDSALTLTPDSGLMSTGVYPIFIDPSWSANSAHSNQNGWTYVTDAYPSQAYMNNDTYNDGDARAGYQAWSKPYGKAHSYFQFAIPSAIWKKHIISATMQITEIWSSSTATTTLKLYHTGKISKSTTWNNQPSKGSLITSVSAAAAHSSSEHPEIDFNVLSEVASAASGSWSTATIGIWNSNETDRDYWRKFEHKPVIAITYNAVPNKPTDAVTSPSVPCTGGLIGNTDVTLTSTVSDPDGSQTQVEADYTVNDDTAKVSLGTTKVTVSNKKSAPIKYAKTKFADGHTYSWSVLAYDGKDKSGATSTCHFTIDHTQPGAPDVTDDSADNPPARSAIMFHFDQAALSDKPKSYVYSLNVTPPATIPVSDTPFADGTLVAAVANGPTDRAITPTRIGTNTLYVYAIDAAKNPSPVTAVTFTTLGLSTPDPSGDLSGDGIPDFAAVGGSAHAGLWLYKGTDAKGHVATAGVDIGALGVKGDTNGTAADWTGATTDVADVDADGTQDILVRLPATGADGNVVFVPGRGDGSVLNPTAAQTVSLERIDGSNGNQIVDQVTAVPADPATLPDLYAVVGDTLYLYSAHSIAGAYDSPEPLSTGWTGHTISAARSAAGSVLLDRNDVSGQLDSWTIVPAADEAQGPTITRAALATTGFDKASTPIVSAADIDVDGRPDLWAVTKTGDLRAYLPATNGPLAAPVVTAIAFK